MPKKSTLGISMIMRDEVENLPKSLSPVMALVDDAVVLDTGSRDGGKSLARSYGARVFDMPWKGDFSLARNQALASARTDYVLWLDADNHISPENVARIREALPARGEEPVVLMATEKVLPQGDRLWQKRVFPKMPGVFFRGVIHEQLCHPEWMAVKLTDAEISHWGYADPVLAKKKGERNLKLLLSAPGTLNGDFYHLYQTGKTLLNLRKFEDAKDFLARAARCQTANLSLWSHAVILLSEAHKALGAQSASLRVLEALVDARPDYGPGRYRLGKALYALGKDLPAAAELDKALALGLSDPGWGAPSEKLSFHCASLLGKILSENGREEEAEKAYRKALELFPANPEPRVALAELAMVTGKPRLAENYLTEALELAPLHRKARHLYREINGGQK
ncbi:MAG: tetratricopeptide repeat protein [Deltaproteobacteria bacterium]|jgi:tetratricopeptide (TPR) repeat protein|nr:tetratricopeptide repeat protein [Deltaproteobacteria bacterium]